MPLLIVDKSGEILPAESKGRSMKFILRNIELDPRKKYEIGLRYISLTINSGTSVLADDEFALPFMVKCGLVAKKDYLLVKATNDPITTRILAPVDLTEATAELSGTQSIRNILYNDPYFTDMESQPSSEFDVELVDFNNNQLDFFDAGSEIIQFTLFIEYREKK